MKRVKKPKGSGKVEISGKKLEKIKREVAREATERAVLLNLAATQEVKSLTEDEMCEIFEMISLWVKFMDDHVLKLKDVQEVIERKTGVKLKGW